MCEKEIMSIIKFMSSAGGGGFESGDTVFYTIC